MRPSRRRSFHCFGCQEGGDVISFLMKLDHLTFAETVERLAGRYGVQLRYEEGGSGPAGSTASAPASSRRTARRPSSSPSSSPRPRRLPGRQFLSERGFDQAAAEHFGVGFAPKGWDALTNHLRGRASPTEELIAGGLVSQGQRGVYDRFRGRLIWPIRDITGDVVGFGARHLFEDDQGPKYLNTPETPIYKKSSVLYGVDLAKKDIAAADAGRGRRGLHRRDGLPPLRRRDRDRHLRHRVRRGPHQDPAPAADGPERVPRRGGLHLRRRLRRAEGRAQGVPGRPEVRHPDLRRGRARRHGPVRAAPAQGRRRGTRPGRATRAAVRVRDPLDDRRATTSTPPRAAPRRPAAGMEVVRQHPRRVAARRLRPVSSPAGSAWPTPTSWSRSPRRRRRGRSPGARADDGGLRRPTRTTRRSATSATCSRSCCRRLHWRPASTRWTPSVFTAPAYAAVRAAVGRRGRAPSSRLGGGRVGGEGRRCRPPTTPYAGWSASSPSSRCHPTTSPHPLRHRGAGPARGARCHASDRGGQVAAAAHEPGRAEWRVQPLVR